MGYGAQHSELCPILVKLSANSVWIHGGRVLSARGTTAAKARYSFLQYVEYSTTSAEQKAGDNSNSNSSKLGRWLDENKDKPPKSDDIDELVATTTGKDAPGQTAASYRRPTPPTGVPLSKILSNVFPLSYTESFRQWQRRHGLERAEQAVLNTLPFYPSDETRKAQTLNVPIGDSNYIHELEIKPKEETLQDNHLVLLHGYGAGLGFYYRNFDEISKVPGWKIHALDLLGYGLSSRPKAKLRKDLSRAEGVRYAESYFVDALERWRQARGIKQFTLVAHSLGAYIGSAYATKYPERVRKMMLVSPAGVPRTGVAIPEKEIHQYLYDNPEKHDYTVFQLSSDALKSSMSLGFTYKKSSAARIPKVPPWFQYLWECHWSPFSIVRYGGPIGPKLVSGWTSRRFAQLDQSEASALHDYVYSIFNARGSGEYYLNYLLAPGAQARWPLVDRAHDIPCETEWVYGDHDWMDVDGGYEACRRINAMGGSATLTVVRNSGHHVYLDNPQDFNDLVKRFMA